jgi:hypothetical protein
MLEELGISYQVAGTPGSEVAPGGGAVLAHCSGCGGGWVAPGRCGSDWVGEGHLCAHREWDLIH